MSLVLPEPPVRMHKCVLGVLSVKVKGLCAEFFDSQQKVLHNLFFLVSAFAYDWLYHNLKEDQQLSGITTPFSLIPWNT